MKGNPETPRCGFSRCSFKDGITGSYLATRLAFFAGNRWIGFPSRLFKQHSWTWNTNCEFSQHTNMFLLVAVSCEGKMVDLLNEHGVEFDTFDILSDEEVRQGLKDYSNWPTYPQLYAKGKLLGGLDIIKELAEEGSLTDELSAWDPHRSRAWRSKAALCKGVLYMVEQFRALNEGVW